MYNDKLNDGLFFTVKDGGAVLVYVTNATVEELAKLYKEKETFEELKEGLKKLGRKVNRFTPVYHLGY